MFVLRYIISLYRGRQAEEKPPFISRVDVASPPTPIRGSQFSDVFEARYEGRKVCVKRVRIFETDESRQTLQDNIAEDARRWQKLKHPHILQFYGVDRQTFSPMIALVTPWMDCNIIQYLRGNQETSVKTLILEIADGLVYLHGEKMVHCDLRGANVLIDTEGHVKLSDVGLAPHADEATAQMTTLGSGRGPGRWMAPELHYPQKFDMETSVRTPESDIFAFAMTILEMYTLAPPFAHMPNDAAVFLAVVKDNRPERPEASRCRLQQPPENRMWDLILQCWAPSPKDRPSASEAYARIGKLQAG